MRVAVLVVALLLLVAVPAACFTVKLEREVVFRTEREVTIKPVEPPKPAANAPAKPAPKASGVKP